MPTLHVEGVPNGLAVYAVLSQVAGDPPATAWDGAAFGAYTGPAYATGAVTLAGLGGGVYEADLAGALTGYDSLPPGTYAWQAFARQGGTPDRTTDADYRLWVGSVAVAGAAADLAAARRRTPWPEPVSLTSTRAAGDVGPVALYADGCYRVSLREAAASNGVYTTGDVRFTLPNPLPGSLGDPKPRDVVTWKGAAYTVLDVTGSDWYPSAPFWAVTGRSPRIAYDLRETLAVRRPTSVPGTGGMRAVSSWATVWTGDGRLQITDTVTEPDTAGLHATRTRADCFLAGAVAVRAGDVIDQDDDTRWEVVEQLAPDPLGLLTTVRVQRFT